MGFHVCYETSLPGKCSPIRLKICLSCTVRNQFNRGWKKEKLAIRCKHSEMVTFFEKKKQTSNKKNPVFPENAFIKDNWKDKQTLKENNLFAIRSLRKMSTDCDHKRKRKYKEWESYSKGGIWWARNQRPFQKKDSLHRKLYATKGSSSKLRKCIRF